jgi:hypothetical protein
MGQILVNQWEVLTKLNGIKFTYQCQKFELQGLAKVSYRNDEIDTYKNVEIPDPDEFPKDTLKIMMNTVMLHTDWDTEANLFNAIYGYVVEVLEDEISLDKTDLTSADFEIENGLLDTLDEVLLSMGLIKEQCI